MEKMKLKMAILLSVLLCAFMCLAFLPGVGSADGGATAAKADTVTSATPNYRSFLGYDLKSMPETGGHYTCLKAQAPFTYFTRDWYGVKLSYLLDVEVGMKDDTTAVKFIAEDGYSVTLTLDEIRNPNPDGLYTLLAWKKGEADTTGGPYQEMDDTEGPFRLIVPQEVIGPHDTGTPNWNKAVKMVRAIEVQPTPPGIPNVEYENLPPDEITIYGNILNRHTCTVSELQSIKSETATYHWLNDFGTEGDTVFTGIPFDFLLDEVIGVQDDATGATLVAFDGYSSAFTLEQIRTVYEGGLEMMMAWSEDGEELGPEPDGDGPIMLVRPQAAADDVNKPDWAKNVRMIVVGTVGESPVPEAGSIPADRILVCGKSDPGNIPSTWYFAEGYTGGGFEEWISVGNPNSWETTVDIEYMIEGADNVAQTVEVPAKSRTTVKVNDIVGSDKNVSARLEGSHADSIVAERAMYWNGGNGGHCAPGISTPDSEWFIAEGSTKDGFDTWVLLQNPGEEAATANVTYMTGSGEMPGPVLTLEPHSRVTVKASDTVPDEWDVSTQVASDNPVIAEYAMYWNDGTRGICSTGVASSGTQWYLAEGCTAGGHETWTLIQNPGDEPAAVQVAYINAQGERPGPAFDLPAGSRRSVNAAETIPEDWNVSTKVTSDKPVIATRSVYWGDRAGGHSENGVSNPGFKSFLAEGCTAGGYQTWVLLMNPGPGDATAYITYLTENGAVEKDPVPVAAGQRVSINVAEDVGETYNVTTQVNSSAPLAVERSIYWSGGSVDGTCSRGFSAW